MILIPMQCPHCHSDHVIKGGITQAGKQRYKCQNPNCTHYSFQLDLTYKGRSPEVKEQERKVKNFNGYELSGITGADARESPWLRISYDHGFRLKPDRRFSAHH
jgi:hypothetical protein